MVKGAGLEQSLKGAPRAGQCSTLLLAIVSHKCGSNVLLPLFHHQHLGVTCFIFASSVPLNDNI